MAALVQIPVAVLVDRIKASSQWVEHIWQPRAVLVGEPQTQAWTRVSGDEERATFYAGSSLIELHRADAGNYRDNLAGDCKLWVIMAPTLADIPYELVRVTADPSEGEMHSETGVNLVETVPMPDAVRETIERFVAEHPVEENFHKRTRERADPEMLRDPPVRSGGHD